MAHIAIMTDSNSGIMPAAGKAAGIHVIPMPVLMDEHTYYEGQDLTPEEFYEKLSGGSSATTSQPAPGIIVEMWKKLLKSYDEVLYIPMSSGLSNTCQTAAMLSQEDEFSGRVHVVDNHRISVTQAQSVYDARILADTGKSGRELKEILERESLDASIYIAVDTLEYLKKGGRITPAAAAIGTVLNLKPVLTIQGDRLDACAKSRGMKAAFKTMCRALEKDIRGRFSHTDDGRILKIGIASTLTDQEKLSCFQEELKRHFPGLELFSAPLTMSIGCHTGPGALGIGAFMAHISE